MHHALHSSLRCDLHDVRSFRMQKEIRRQKKMTRLPFEDQHREQRTVSAEKWRHECFDRNAEAQHMS